MTRWRLFSYKALFSLADWLLFIVNKNAAPKHDVCIICLLFLYTQLHHAQGLISQKTRVTILCVFSVFCYVIQFRHRWFRLINFGRLVSTGTSEAGLILEAWRRKVIQRWSQESFLLLNFVQIYNINVPRLWCLIECQKRNGPFYKVKWSLIVVGFLFINRCSPMKAISSAECYCRNR